MKRKASAVWNGGLKDGKGTVSSDSGVLANTPYSFSTRFEDQPGTNPEELIAAAGFKLIRNENVSENAASVSRRWHEARQRHKDALIEIEGEERFEGLQKFFTAVHNVTSERRLSRIVYLVEKNA